MDKDNRRETVTLVAGRIQGGQTTITVVMPSPTSNRTITVPTTNGNWTDDVRNAVKNGENGSR